MAAKGIASKVISKMSGNKRPPLEPFYIYLLVILMAYSVADLAILKYRPEMLPSEPPPKRPEKRVTLKTPESHYAKIRERNIFNSDGVIPEPLKPKEKEDTPLDAPAVKSTLPIQLIGTIVHFNPARSIASILVKSAGQISPYMVDDEIERLATIISIERRKVIIRNKRNGRKEFIDIPAKLKLNFGVAKSADPVSTSNKLVRALGPNKYSVRRSDIDNALENLPNLLKEARMVPNKKPNGDMEGFVFKWIKPGSVIEQLGFKVGDVITGINGEPINSTRKALEAFNTLKDSTEDLELGRIRGGKRDNLEYRID